MIIVNYGKDWVKATYDALAASDIGDYLRHGMNVAIKPNMVNVTPPSNGATTHPEVVEGIIKFLRDFGIRDIQIMESSAIGNNTKRAYKVCGYEGLENKYGVPLVDLKNAPTKTLTHHELDIKIAKAALEVDFLINVPVLKAHCQTRLTCCMKNLKGCIPESEMKRFHSLGLHKPIAALAALLPVHYNVVDGICGDLSFEEGGTPVEANRVIVGQDMVQMDTFCAELIGYRPKDIGYLNYSPPAAPAKIVELNAEKKPTREHKSARLADRYSSDIADDAACSTCYAALVFAMHRSNRSNRSGSQKIHIGQGYRGKSGTGIGIGNCTRRFSTCVEGCPPKAVDIMEVL